LSACCTIVVPERGQPITKNFCTTGTAKRIVLHKDQRQILSMPSGDDQTFWTPERLFGLR